MHDEEGHGPFMAATKVARAGYPVFPIAPKRKKPSVEGGFYAATTDESRIAAWLEEGRKNHNVAVPTGVLSGIVVIEADDTEGCAWMEKTYGPPTVKSAHEHEVGGHWYFSHPRDGKVTSRKVENVPVSLDRKGDGGYVLVPPSTGKVWINEGKGLPEKSSLPPLPTELRGVKKAVPENPDRAEKRGVSNRRRGEGQPNLLPLACGRSSRASATSTWCTSAASCSPGTSAWETPRRSWWTRGVARPPTSWRERPRRYPTH